MADSDSKDSTDQYYKDLVNISIDTNDTGSDISVYTFDPDQLLTMGVKGKHCDNAGRASFRYALFVFVIFWSTNYDDFHWVQMFSIRNCLLFCVSF